MFVSKCVIFSKSNLNKYEIIIIIMLIYKVKFIKRQIDKVFYDHERINEKR